MSVICIFGDSITWGASDAEQGGWAEQLKIHFGERDDAEVYSLGISGDNTDSLVERIEGECSARKPNMILIAIGVNDSQHIEKEHDYRVPVERFKKNLSKLLISTRKFTENIIFIGLVQVDETKTKPFDPEKRNHYQNDVIKRYNNEIRIFCEINKLKFIEMLDVIKAADLADGLHPNAEGHRKMFVKIKENIEESVASGV